MQIKMAVIVISFEHMKHRVRFGVGLLVGMLCIALVKYFPDHELAIQVTIWSLIAAAILIGENYMYFHEKWFWKACLLVTAVHVAVIATFWRSLPFSTVGVAMLMSFAEAVVLLIVFRRMATGQ
jgi:hypothetical protein